ncbi:MAG: outer membrane protein assembly factor BamD [Capnocytophaga sp.]|nr:outer membrane protein assembly factor BamD [Capnocytophaga sp.]
MKKIVLLGLLGIGMLSSCGEYQKALKSQDVTTKYSMAEDLYNKGEYRKAIRLFEQIMPQYIGKPQGERIIYMFADSYYKVKQYQLASYQFERLQKLYPKSEKAPEAAFLEAKGMYLETPAYSVDQTNTYKALEKLQFFLDRYSEGEYVQEANEMALDLLIRLQRKNFEIAKQYDRIRDYQAAIKSIDNFLADNPGSVFKEEALYIRLHSAYEWAVNSVEHRKEARLNTAKEAYENLIRSYPETPFKKEADKMLDKIETSLKEYL